MGEAHEQLVSLIVVNYNGFRFLEACVSSVLNSTYTNYEVIIVDNGSRDRSIYHLMHEFDQDPRVKCILLHHNYGYGMAINIGVGYSKGNYLIFLNNDTVVEPGFISELVRVLDSDPSIAVAQSKLLLLDDKKRIDCAGGFLYITGYGYERGWREIDKGQYNQIQDIFYAKGACMMVRRKVFEEVGAFDTTLFFLYDETDLCWRVWTKGYRVVIAPSSVVYHKVGGALAGSNPTYAYYMYRNRLYVSLKNCELTLLIKHLPVMVLVEFVLVAHRCIKSLNPIFMIQLLRAWLWNLKNLKQTLMKRRVAQNMRRVSDRKLVGKVIIPNILPFSRMAKSFLHEPQKAK